jgi:hypothetical protein
MANYKVGTNVSISDLIKSGGNATAVTDKYLINTNTTITYTASSNAFENPSSFGYKKDDVDIANSMVAYYIDYTSDATIPNDNTVIPSWCTKLRFIAIGGGGGGGGGSGDPEGWDLYYNWTPSLRQTGTAGSSGTGGGGGGLAAAYIDRVTYPPPYVIDIGSGGDEGGDEGSPNAAGNNGTNGNATTVKYSTNTIFLTANGGGKGRGGRDPQDGSETTSNTTNTGFGGTGSSNITPKWEATGNASNSSTDASLWSSTSYRGPSRGGTVAYGTASTTLTNVTVPTIATADTGTSYSISVNDDIVQTRNNIGAGFGQGGIGGINAPNSNGHRGQKGGDGLVRVYFIK